jgi:hypothetical protein
MLDLGSGIVDITKGAKDELLFGFELFFRQSRAK